MLLAFAYSVSTKRQFIIDSSQWNYGNFIDYFHLPSSDYYPQLNRTSLVQDNHPNNLVDHLKTTRTGTQLYNFFTAAQKVQSMKIKRQVAHYLWKSISHQTLAFIRNCKITNLSNYIAIHIRKGDKIEEAPEIPLNKYIQSIEKLLIKNPNIRKIFVDSDDRTIIEKFHQLKPNWNFMNVYDKYPQKINLTGHFQYHFNRLSRTKKLFETRLLMCELDMLINAKYVICGMSSNICRLVQILRYQHPSTVISLDRSWYGI